MRNIFIVTASQVVTSEAHPEGVYSVADGYPKYFDSRNYNATTENPNGNEARALEVAEAEFHNRVAANLNANNRAMWAVTVTRADGRQIMRDSRGRFPDMTPASEPEPEEEPIEPVEG